MAEKEQEKKWAAVLRLRGLRKRWIVNTILPVLILLVLLVTMVSVGVSTYYYSSVEAGLTQQAEAMSGSFNDYFMNSYAEYNQMAAQAVDTYEDKSRIELQFISSTGRIQMSTSGLTAGTSPGTSDIIGAITDQSITPFQGRDPETGEKILAVSAPVLGALYPVAIVLIALSFFQRWLEGRRWVYPLAVLCTGAVSVLSALGDLGLPLAFLDALPLAGLGLGWLLPALIGTAAGLLCSGR